MSKTDHEQSPALARLLGSPTYRRADQDVDFLNARETRGVRLALEYQKVELGLLRCGVEGTIVVFGSTRIPEPEVAQRRVVQARQALEGAPGDPALQMALARAERLREKSRYYDEARALGRLVGESGAGPQDCRLVVMTGGGPGMMEAAHRGSTDVGARSVGLNIDLPHEQAPNPYITPELCFRFRYFAIRKLHFLLRARGLVAFPGGFGTLDELFETLTLIQTRKMAPVPVVLVGESFWRRAFDVDFLVEEGVISPEDRGLFCFAETGAEAWRAISAWYEDRGTSLCA